MATCGYYMLLFDVIIIVFLEAFVTEHTVAPLLYFVLSHLDYFSFIAINL